MCYVLCGSSHAALARASVPRVLGNLRGAFGAGLGPSGEVLTSALETTSPSAPTAGTTR